MDSLITTLERLRLAGYDVSFAAVDGRLGCPDCADTVAPDQLVVDEIVRLEGESDPDEELVVYALSSGPCGRRGTFIAGYGPNVSDGDLSVELALRHSRHAD